jgi:N-acetylneuraminic acid mutarotase
VTDSWVTLPPMPSAFRGSSTVVHRNKLWVFGGYDTADRDTAYAYEPYTSTWSQNSPMPDAFLSYQAAGTGAVGSSIFVAGGWGVGDDSYMSTLWSYDIAADTYDTSLPDMPSGGRYFGAGVTIGSTVYVLGGQDTAGAAATAEAYTVATSSWAVLAPMPEGAINPIAAAIVGGATIYAGQLDQVGGRQ